MNFQGIEEIAKNIFWVGDGNVDLGLHCNPYLIIDGDEAVLIDPGSVLDFEQVYKNVSSLISLDKIKYVVLHHQDPDFCASVPLFEQKGCNFKIVTHWRTQTLIKYYGVKSSYYIVNENNYNLELKSGRILDFVLTPYLHFSGAIATYDNQTKTLFSSDLFGSFSQDWSIYAKDDYIEKMKSFHEHYMPSNDILRPVMEILLSMDIETIAPQHGSIIKNNIKEHILALRDLECGAFLVPVKKNLMESGGYKYIFSIVLKRYGSIFSKEEVLDVISDLNISCDKDTLEISDYKYSGDVLWDLLFAQILSKKGIKWLLYIEPMVQKLSKEYDVPMPEVFKSSLLKAQSSTIGLMKENKALKEMNERLEISFKDARDKLMKCPVTGLYNYSFFKNYLSNYIKNILAENTGQNPVIIILKIDEMLKINFSYGDNEVNEILKTIAYYFKNSRQENMTFYRLQGASFACFMPDTSKTKAIEFAEKIRTTINNSEKFIEKITVSMGLVSFDEIQKENFTEDEIPGAFFELAVIRLKHANIKGENILCSDSLMDEEENKVGKIVIADTDDANIDVLKTFLINLKYEVIIAKDGEEAINIIERELPDLIIIEIMLPKFDGFLVREKLLSQSNTKNIPFVIMSHLKNDNSVIRASSLGIEHYLKKPYMLSEIIGIVKNKVKGDSYK